MCVPKKDRPSGTCSVYPKTRPSLSHSALAPPVKGKVQGRENRKGIRRRNPERTSGLRVSVRLVSSATTPDSTRPSPPRPRQKRQRLTTSLPDLPISGPFALRHLDAQTSPPVLDVIGVRFPVQTTGAESPVPHGGSRRGRSHPRRVTNRTPRPFRSLPVDQCRHPLSSPPVDCSPPLRPPRVVPPSSSPVLFGAP